MDESFQNFKENVEALKRIRSSLKLSFDWESKEVSDLLSLIKKDYLFYLNKGEKMDFVDLELKRKLGFN